MPNAAVAPARSSLAALAFVNLLVALPASAQGEDDRVLSQTVEVCDLGAGHAGKLTTEVMKQLCGNESCSHEEVTSLSLDADTILGVTVSVSEGEPEHRITLACERGRVRLLDVRDAGTAKLEFRYDPASGMLGVTRETRERVEGAWHRAPTHDPREAQRRAELGELLGTVSSPEGRPIEGLGDLSAAVEVLTARDALARGAWELALLGDPSPRVLSPVLERRWRAFAARAEVRHQRELPLRLIEKRAIGTTLAVQTLPLDVGEQATLFWRGAELCVVAEDDPRSAMRCYSPADDRWGPRVASSLPVSGGHQLAGLTFGHVSRCMSDYVVQRSVPLGPTPCDGGPGEPWQELVGIVDGDAMLLERARTFVLNRAPDRDEALSTQAGGAVLRRSAGTFVVGNSCCRFLQNGSLRRLGDDDQRVWNVLGLPPDGEAWLGPPLVSPDQRWVVAQSGNGRGPRPVTLWVFRVSAVRGRGGQATASEGGARR